MSVWVTKLWEIESAVHAATRAKARYATIKGAREAGYKVPFTAKVRVRRAQHLDEMDAREGELRNVEDAERQIRAAQARRMAPVLARVEQILAAGCPCGLPMCRK